MKLAFRWPHPLTWAICTLIVVMTIVGNKARAPSSGQHQLQHSLDKRLGLSAIVPSTLVYLNTLEAEYRSPGFSFTLLCINIQQLLVGSFFNGLWFLIIPCLRRNVRIRYVWVAALKRAHYIFSRRKADSLVKKKGMVQATGSWHRQCALSVPKNFQTLNIC